nr:MAG TPA: hypothetical protein [Caudoviricetes sp.]
MLQSYYYIGLFSYIGLLIGNLFFLFPVFTLCRCIGLYRALHCLYRQRVIYWLMSEL